MTGAYEEFIVELCFLPVGIGTVGVSAAGAMLRLCKKRLFSVAGKKVYLVKLTFCLAVIGKAAFYLWVLYSAVGAIWGGGKDTTGNDLDCEYFANRHIE